MHIMTNPDAYKFNQMMAGVGEKDRSPEFKIARAKIIDTVDDMFLQLEEAKNSGDRPFKFGSAGFGMLGIERSTVQNPFGGVSLLSEKTKATPGLYVGHDKTDGQDVIFLRRPDKTTVEIRRDALLTGVILPADPASSWDPAPRTVSNLQNLVSITESQEDGGSHGYSVTASGAIYQATKEPGRNGMNSTGPIGPTDIEAVASAQALFDQARQDFFLDRS